MRHSCWGYPLAKADNLRFNSQKIRFFCDFVPKKHGFVPFHLLHDQSPTEPFALIQPEQVLHPGCASRDEPLPEFVAGRTAVGAGLSFQEFHEVRA